MIESLPDMAGASCGDCMYYGPTVPSCRSGHCYRYAPRLPEDGHPKMVANQWCGEYRFGTNPYKTEMWRVEAVWAQRDAELATTKGIEQCQKKD